MPRPTREAHNTESVDFYEFLDVTMDYYPIVKTPSGNFPRGLPQIELPVCILHPIKPKELLLVRCITPVPFALRRPLRSVGVFLEYSIPICLLIAVREMIEVLTCYRSCVPPVSMVYISI